jgi:hypothetical protein
MNKDAIIRGIQGLNAECDEIRDTLDRIADDIDTYNQKEVDRLFRLLWTTLAYRNGLAHALYLSEQLTVEEMTYISKTYNIPFFHFMERITKYE